jgi:uncharacterized surface protein with fasciclin (FAS1) repeats
MLSVVLEGDFSFMKRNHWIAAGAIAAMLAAASPAVKAQDTTTPTGADSIPTIAPVAPIDYSVLRNQAFTYTDLQQAKASGLSDDETATVAKIAEETGQPFSSVRDELLDGATFPQLAVKYNLSLSDLYNVDDEKTKIANYKQAYETTGTYALKAMMNGGGMMASDMSAGTGSMSSSSMSSNSTATATTATGTTGTDTGTATGDVVDVAMATPQLSTLVKAIQAAGLVDTLKGAGPFTIFAPNNRAFARVPKAQLNALLADPTALKNVLTYHVIAGQKIDAATAMSMTSPTSPPTVQGGTLQVVTRNGHVMINNATVVRPDIQASNGIIHIIDRVLMPPAATP